MATRDHPDNRPPSGESFPTKRIPSYSSEPSAERQCCSTTSGKMLAVVGENNNDGEICPATDDELVIYSRKGAIPDELQSRFASMTAGDNFGLRHAQQEPKLQVIFKGQHFQFYSYWPNKTSWWKCIYHRLQGCRVMIGIDAEKARVFAIKEVHNHNPIVEKLLECPQGRGVTICDGGEKTFWLTYSAGTFRAGQLSRNLILDGYRYHLSSVQMNNVSLWFCSRGSKCKARLVVQGVYRQIKQSERHNHKQISEEKMDKIRADCNVDLDLVGSKADLPSAKVNRIITYDAQHFRLQSVEPEGTRLWCCLWRDLRNCPMNIRMSSDGKHVEPVTSEVRHNHPDNLVGVYLQADGWHSIFDKQEKIESLFWLFAVDSVEPDMKRRGMIYQGYKYLLVTIGDRGDSEWKCAACETFLQIAGLFWTASQRGNHTHGPLTFGEINAITKQNIVGDDFLPNNVPLSKSALLTILSTPNPNRNFQLCHQADVMKVLQDGFEYFYVCSKPNYSLWRCIYSTIRCCDATVRVDNDGLRAVHTVHNHSVELWDLFYSTLGQHTILDECSNTSRTFHFLIQPTFLRPLPHLLYEGHLFGLDFITKSGNASFWVCTGAGCRVALTVTGQFGKLCVEGLPHVEPPLAGDEQAEWIRCYGSSNSF